MRHLAFVQASLSGAADEVIAQRHMVLAGTVWACGEYGVVAPLWLLLSSCNLNFFHLLC
jgi:hypothetical protein